MKNSANDIRPVFIAKVLCQFYLIPHDLLLNIRIEGKTKGNKIQNNLVI